MWSYLSFPEGVIARFNSVSTTPALWSVPASPEPVYFESPAQILTFLWRLFFGRNVCCSPPVVPFYLPDTGWHDTRACLSPQRARNVLRKGTVSKLVLYLLPHSVISPTIIITAHTRWALTPAPRCLSRLLFPWFSQQAPRKVWLPLTLTCVRTRERGGMKSLPPHPSALELKAQGVWLLSSGWLGLFPSPERSTMEGHNDVLSELAPELGDGLKLVWTEKKKKKEMNFSLTRVLCCI